MVKIFMFERPFRNGQAQADRWCFLLLGLLIFEPCANQKSRHNRVHHRRRPQQAPGPLAAGAEIGEVQRCKKAVARHCPECRGGDISSPLPGQPRSERGKHASPNAIKAMPATRATGMAMPVSSSPNNNCPTSEGTTSNANPVAASPTAAKTRPFSSVRFHPFFRACDPVRQWLEAASAPVHQ